MFGELVPIGLWLGIPILCLSLIIGLFGLRRSSQWAAASLLAVAGGTFGFLGPLLFIGKPGLSDDLPLLYFRVFLGEAGFVFGAVAGVISGRVAGREKRLLPHLLALAAVLAAVLGTSFFVLQPGRSQIDKCTLHLMEIGKALARYRDVHQSYPAHLSDLYPEFIPDRSTFHCPNDSSPGSPGRSDVPPDPRIPTSYVYEMRSDSVDGQAPLGPPGLHGRRITWAQARISQWNRFGEWAPILRCFHSRANSDLVSNLRRDGTVYFSRSRWETEPLVVASVLDRIEHDLTGGAARWLKTWDPSDTIDYFHLVERDRTVVGRNLADRLRKVADKLSTVLQGHVAAPLLRLLSDSLTTAASPAEVSQVGPSAGDFALNDLSFHRVHLSDFRGRVVLLHFWSSSSKTSEEDAPLIEKVYRKYRGRGLVVLGLADQYDVPAARRFAAAHFSFPILLWAPLVAKQYEVQAPPCTIVLDRANRVVYRHEGYDESLRAGLERRIKSELAATH